MEGVLTKGIYYRRTLTVHQKKDYINAVKCMQSTPSISDKSLIPGVKTRYDDFHAVHITHSIGLLEFTGGIHLVVCVALYD